MQRQAFQPYRDAFPEDVRASPETFQAHVEDLTRRDVKIAYHKNLQGYLWEDGYKSGAYSTPLFPDVAPRLRKWKDEGVQLAIYSSGSVFAQKLLFQHVSVHDSAAGKKIIGSHSAEDAESTSAAADGEGVVMAEPSKQVTDMTDLISGWFDTTNAGLKSEANSYSKIAATLNVRCTSCSS
ncbi:hypothetical protein LTR36_000440 [Oleoguttula mirabilis]|uniref:Enolase-phosphatase E1 n=1 Tax=Oleoguttula mirabilis TaxID=1507867 RepID=A0AAV9JZP9_9PEZI|nr:hypothetical protein LTR36_000440 [Oleoguttula mirabilis]